MLKHLTNGTCCGWIVVGWLVGWLVGWIRCNVHQMSVFGGLLIINIRNYS